MIVLHPIQGNSFAYQRMIGTGGLGTGILFKLEDSHTLGRNESRLGELLPYKDYCKLHIISHYVSVLLGAHTNGVFQTHPIGKLGDDEPGEQIYSFMKQTGMTMDHVHIEPGMNTLFSVCFQYPDSTGGNITSSQSASGLVSEQDIQAYFEQHTQSGKQDIILAVPEVPLPARLDLLKQGRNRGSFNAVSILSSEAESFANKDGFAMTDLLAINIDEARAISGRKTAGATSREVAESCVEVLIAHNAGMLISITNGPFGSYGYANNSMQFIAPIQTEVVSTSGAGDAFLSGIIAGLCCKLPFLKPTSSNESHTSFQSAMELGTLLASLSVTSPDTIHQTANTKLLLEYARKKQIPFSDEFAILFNQAL